MKRIKIKKPKAATANKNCLEIADIEEAGITPTLALKYFSPIQTRNQRKTAFSEVNKEQGLVLKKPTKLECNENIDDTTSEQVTELAACEATASLNWSPPFWREALQNIRIMRKAIDAPVDTMGCGECADADADEKTQRFHKLVALMLSSQTKDQTTFAAMARLKAKSLTPQQIASTKTDELEALLCPVSFYKNKAKYLKQMAQILIDNYDGDIPNSIEGLVALPGVGPKMAHICMFTAWKQVTGIGVDVHVHRIANRLKWLPKPTKEPEQTRTLLENWLPRNLWPEVNHLLVGFGQTICAPVKPKCEECLNVGLCPSAEKSAKKKKLITDEGKEIIRPALQQFENQAKLKKKI